MEEGCFILNDDKKKKDLRSLLWYIGVIAIGVLFSIFIAGLIRVDGSSMEPTLANGQYVVVYKLASKYTTNDIVVVRLTNSSNIIKRVIGLPGDVVEMNYNELYVNGVLVDTLTNRFSLHNNCAR